jgi:hypothetical protein
MTYDPQHPTQPEPAVPLDAANPTTPIPQPAPVQPGPVTPAGKRPSSGRWLNVVLGIAVLFAIGGVAFAIGRTTAPAAAATTSGRFPGGGQFPAGSGAPVFGNGGGGQDGQGGLGGFGGGNGITVSGTVESIDGTTMTITTANGQTVEVTLGSDTTYSTKSPASSSDVTPGATVQVQLDLAGGFGGRGNGGNGGTGQTPNVMANGITVVP